MYTILIIDDDPSLLSMAEAILQMEGYHVHTAPDGASGLALVREICPDLILCDVLMPRMDGYAVLQTLRGDKTLCGCPFVFVSAVWDPHEVRRGMSAGADDYLAKPFSAEELLAAVKGRMGRTRSYMHYLQAGDQKKQAFLRANTSRRERAVLLMVGQGLKSRDISQRLGISLKTVEMHRSRLMDKLGASNAAILARWAVIAEQLNEDPGW